MFITCKQRSKEESYVFCDNIFYFVYNKASSLLEVQVFYYLSAGKGIISLRYVLSGVKMIYLVYIFICLY